MMTKKISNREHRWREEERMLVQRNDVGLKE